MWLELVAKAVRDFQDMPGMSGEARFTDLWVEYAWQIQIEHSFIWEEYDDMLVECCRDTIRELPEQLRAVLWEGESARYTPAQGFAGSERIDVLSRRLRSRIDAEAQRWSLPDCF